MTGSVPTMKRHSCPSCSGQLVINIAKQMYECPFCGMTFDYEYFREDDVLDRAARALRAGEFTSAGEAYDFMLQKEPSNFEALRGRILVTARLNSTQDLGYAERLKIVESETLDTHVTGALEHAKPEHTAYFEGMKEIFGKGAEYRREMELAKDLREGRKAEFKKIRSLDRDKSEFMVETRDPMEKNSSMHVHPKAILAISLTIYIIWCLFILAIMNLPGAVTGATTTSRATKSTTHQKNVDMWFIEKDMEESGVDRKTIKEAQSFVESIKGDADPGEDDENSIIRGTKSTKNTKNTKNAKSKNGKNKTDSSHMQGTLFGFILLIIIPGIAEAFLVIVMLARMKSLKRYDDQISNHEKKASDLYTQIKGHEEAANRLRTEIHKIAVELRKIDPAPERVAVPEGLKK